MDNRVFYQHPDLMRSLCVHETVMAIMVNRLNKSKQEQTSMSSMNDMDGLTQTNEGGESQENHPPKVNELSFYIQISLFFFFSFRKIKLNLSQHAANFYLISVVHHVIINERCLNI
jgi:hypothetical protein